MKNAIWYGAFLTLDKRRGEFFDGYLTFAGLEDREEIISLDASLCPAAFDIDDEGWDYFVGEEYVYDLFFNLEYVKKRIKERKDVNLVAVVMEPTHHMCAQGQIENCFFAGYDLMDTDLGMSILTNTGCIPLIKPSLKNKYGLINDFDIISRLKKDIKEKYKDDPQMIGTIFEIWKLVQT